MTQPQREALLELLVLSIFADAHVSLSEEDTLQARIHGLGWESSKPRDIHLLNAMHKARVASESAAKTEAFVAERAGVFASLASRMAALEAIRSVLASDGHAETEGDFLAMLRKHFAPQ
ncbi:MAG: hypothetical protein ACKV19_04205 [Verrucomicrobiales bacterium]